MPDTGWVTIVIRPTAPPPRRTVKLQQTRSETGTRRQRSGKIRRRPRKLSSACNACGPESCKRRSRRWMIYIFVARSGPDPENCQLQRSAIYIFWLLQFSRLRPWFFRVSADKIDTSRWPYRYIPQLPTMASTPRYGKVEILQVEKTRDLMRFYQHIMTT